MRDSENVPCVFTKSRSEETQNKLISGKVRNLAAYFFSAKPLIIYHNSDFIIFAENLLYLILFLILMVNVLRKTIKKDFPDSEVIFSITLEHRTNKLGQSIDVYRIQWNEDNKTKYFVFSSVASALDFVHSNFAL